MVHTWEIIVMVILGGGGVLILCAIMWAMIMRGPPTRPPQGLPAHQVAPAHQSTPTHQDTSDGIELSSQTQGVIPPARQGASEDIERSTPTGIEEATPPAYQA